MNKSSYNRVKATFEEPVIDSKPQFPYSKFVSYPIELRSRFFCWQISRRFSEFCSLFDQLEMVLNFPLPRLPDKVFFNMTPSVIKKRKQSLEALLNTVLQVKDVLNNEIFRKFLNIDDDLLALLNVEEPGAKSPTPVKKFASTKSIACLSFSLSNTKISQKGPLPDFPKLAEDFLLKINDDPENISFQVDQFEAFMNDNWQRDNLKEFEVNRLMFGSGNLLGVFQLAGKTDNRIGCKRLVCFISNLINCEHNPEWERYKKILAKASKQLVMAFDFSWHLVNSDKPVVMQLINIFNSRFEVEKLVREPLAFEKYRKLSAI